LDYLKHKVYERNYEIYAKEELQVRVDAVSRMSDYGLLEQEAESVVQRAVNNLPPRCREIFLLSRIEGLKYCEIADRLNLSENTVGVQMGIALKRLRAALSEY
jgi:RNA polymerase sigma-70 factor (ECF subfamily)